MIGNSGGGKSTLARALAVDLGLPYVEADALLWLPGWRLAEAPAYEAAHARAVARPRWVIDGLGRRGSIPARLARATEIFLVDMALETHLRLAEARQAAWAAGALAAPPAGMPDPPPTEALLRTIREVDREWMPEIRRLVEAADAAGARVHRIHDLEELDRLAAGHGRGG